MTIIRIGLDTSKHVFQIHGVDENEEPVLRRQLQRGEIAKFFAKLPPTRIGLEACGASHHWARLLRGSGHEARLMPPQYIKTYVKRGKNDAISACPQAGPGGRGDLRGDEPAGDAVCGHQDRREPSGTDNARGARSAGQAAHHADQRDRGHAAELGITAAKGPKHVAELLHHLADDAGVPDLAREMIGVLAAQLDGLAAKLKAIEARLMAWHRQDQTSRCLATIPGIGPIGGASFALKSLPSRKRGAGHMTATDPTRRRCNRLASRGPSTYGFRAGP